MPTIYEQLEAACLPYIKSYKEDLTVIDRKAIEEHPELPFVHWTRAYGTQILFLRPWNHESWPGNGEVVPYLFGEATRSHILDQCSVIAKYPFENLRCVHYYHNDLLFGWKLDEVSTAYAIETVEAYVKTVGTAWNAQGKSA